jgi:type II secretory pathway component PulF
MATTVKSRLTRSEESSELEKLQTPYNYRGESVLGFPASGYVNAPNEEVAQMRLENAGIALTSIGERPPSFKSVRKVKIEEIGIFSCQLADRLEAGQSMLVALQAEGRACTNKILREAIFEVAASIPNGYSSSDAFKLRMDVFPEMFCHLVALGETKGDPSDLLKNYGTSQIRLSETIARLKGAMIYPCAVMMVAFAVVIFLMYFFMPKMVELYKGLLSSSDARLPFITECLIGFSNFLTTPAGVLSIIGLIALIIMTLKWMKGPGRETVVVKALDLPVAGPILRLFYAGYVARCLGLLYNVTENIQTLSETAKAVTNPVYKEMTLNVKEIISTRGRTLAEAFAPYPYLMGDEFTAILAAGEASGRLSSQLLRYADLLDDKVRRRIEGLSKTIEPLLIILVGVMIGAIVVAIWSPFFTLIGQLASRGGR